MHIPQIIAVIGLVAFGSWSSPAQASRPIDRPEHRALIYDLEAFGTKAGKIEVVLSKPRSVVTPFRDQECEMTRNGKGT